ncbi:MAG: GNAT family N-acetyltransferase [Pseudomonadota bacterium]|nr:GNAT family N-acetyltransferase [Pseudomonadota bacterium]
MILTFRQADDSDYELAFQAKKQAMGPHITVKWGWDEAYQRSIHNRRWHEKPWFVLMMGETSVGTLSLLRQDSILRFGEFYLLDEYRNRGLGTQVLQSVLDECDQNGEVVILEYLKWNPVGSLYKRFGFKVTHENDVHYFLRREPLKAVVSSS